MKKLSLALPEDLIKALKESWTASKSSIAPDVLRRIGWDRFETFCADLLSWGFNKASRLPVGFIKDTREKKDPVFKELDEILKNAKPQPDDDCNRAYS